LEMPVGAASKPKELTSEEWWVETIEEPAVSFSLQPGVQNAITSEASMPLSMSEDFPTDDPVRYAFEWSKLGDLYLKVGSYDEAIVAYQKALKLNPRYAPAYGNMALAHYHKGSYAESIPLYQKSIDLCKNNKEKAIIWNRLGDAHRRLNNEKSAMAAYQKAARVDSVANPLLSRARMALLGNVRG
jgi:tetratricopeptide (TPR) repeat protein